MTWLLVAAMMVAGVQSPEETARVAVAEMGARQARQAASLGRAFDSMVAKRWMTAVEAWFDAENAGLPLPLRTVLSRVLLGNPGVVSADALYLRLGSPEALGMEWASLWSGPCWPVAGALSTAGAWAIQPDSKETRDELNRWLTLADVHPFELSRDFRIPGVSRPAPGVEAGLLWLAAGRIEFRSGRREAAARCRDKGVEAAGKTGLPRGWADLVFSRQPWRPVLEASRTALSEGKVGLSRRLMVDACKGANRFRDGEHSVDELLSEAQLNFPDIELFGQMAASLKWRCGRAMPMRALWWSLAAAEAMERGEGAEAARRLTAARELSHAVDPGPCDPTPWLWSAERLTRAMAGKPEAGSLPADETVLPGEGPRLRSTIELPPGRWLPSLLPHEAVGYAVADRWASRARASGDLRLLVRMAGEGGRPLEGLAVYAEDLARHGEFLEACETITQHPALSTAAAGTDLALRVQVVDELALRGEPPPDLSGLVGRQAEKARFALDSAQLALFDGDGALAQERLAAVPEEAANHPAVLRVALAAAESIGQEPATRSTVEKLLAARPRDGRALAARGRLAIAEGRLADAISDLKEASSRREGGVAACQSYGRALEAAGRPDEAVAAYLRAWERQPCRAEPLEEMAKAGRPGLRPITGLRLVRAHRALALLLARRQWEQAGRLLAMVRRLGESPGEPAVPGSAASSLATSAEAQCKCSPFEWRTQLDSGLESGSREWLEKTIEAASGSSEAVSLGLDFLSRRAYGVLARLLEAAARPRALQAAAGDPGAPEAPVDPLLGLKRDPERAWTVEGSPFGGSLSWRRRVGFRLALLGVVLLSWVRLHLYLIALFQPGGPFFKWLKR